MGSPIKIIDRYIGRQVLFATLMGVIVLSLVLVLGTLFKEVFELLVDKDLPLDSVLKFIAYILPFSLIFTIPWGFLTAVLLIFGRLSADNELVSLRMAGMSMRRICRPVFLLAVTLVILSLWINTTVAPTAQAEMKKAMYTMVVDDPLSLFVPDRVLDEFGSNIIYAKERDGQVLRGVEIEQLNEKGRPQQYIRAETAEISYNEKTDSLEMELHKMLMISKDTGDVKDLSKLSPGVSADTFHVSLSLEELRQKASEVKHSTIPTRGLRKMLPELSKPLPTHTTLDVEIRDEMSKIRMEVRKRAKTEEIPTKEKSDPVEMELKEMLENSKDAEDVKDLSGKSRGVSADTFDVSLALEELRQKASELNYRTIATRELGKIHLELHQTLDTNKALEREIHEEMSKIRTEIHKRYAFSMACFTFALVGIPLGVTAQRRETSIGFALSLLIAIVYFLFIILADTFRAEPSKHPALLMWVPNVIFVGLGLFLFRRLSRK